MPRKQVHASNAERQRAYRTRKAQAQARAPQSSPEVAAHIRRLWDHMTADDDRHPIPGSQQWKWWREDLAQLCALAVAVGVSLPEVPCYWATKRPDWTRGPIPGTP